MNFYLRHRKPIRLKQYEYTTPGAYFITICTKNRECLFGNIDNNKMLLNDFGSIVCDQWIVTFKMRRNIRLGAWVVMPNHFHGVIHIEEKGVGEVVTQKGTARRAPTACLENFGRPVEGSVSTIVRSFKSSVTKRINDFFGTPGNKIWQRDFYEHVIRNERDLNRIEQYIFDNPRKWAEDKENPSNNL